MSPRENPSEKPAPTRYRAAQQHSSRESTEAIPGSWGCRWRKRPRHSPGSAGPCCNIKAMHEILINVTPQETRVAMLEQGVVQELHIERASARGLVGNICLGRVARVLPGMQ